MGIGATIASVALGARVIEKHFTLDRKQKDADSSYALNPNDLKNLIETVRSAEEALSGEKKVFDEEKSVVTWAKRSVVSAVDILQGAIISREMIQNSWTDLA